MIKMKEGGENPNNDIIEIDWRWLVKSFIYGAAYIILLIALALVFTGCAAQGPQIIVHKYDYSRELISPYGSTFDDPALVVFKNESYYRARIEILKQKPIILEPYTATSDILLPFGNHRVRVVIEKPTNAPGAGGKVDIQKFLNIHVRPEGRSQIIYIYDY